MKKEKFKLNKKILVLLIILVLIILGITIFIGIVGKTKEIEIPSDKALGVIGFSVIFDNDTGYLKTSDIAKHLEEITTKRLPQIYNDVKDYGDFKLKIYYNKNKENIKSWFGITNFDQFSNFVDKLKKTDVNLESWKLLNILRDSLINKSDIDGYAYVEYEVSYDNDKILKFSVYFARKAEKEPIYVIDFV